MKSEEGTAIWVLTSLSSDSDAPEAWEPLPYNYAQIIILLIWFTFIKGRHM